MLNIVYSSSGCVKHVCAGRCTTQSVYGEGIDDYRGKLEATEQAFYQGNSCLISLLS